MGKFSGSSGTSSCLWKTDCQKASCRAASCPGLDLGDAERRGRGSVKVCAAPTASQPFSTEQVTRDSKKVHLKVSLLPEMLFNTTA